MTGPLARQRSPGQRNQRERPIPGHGLRRAPHELPADPHECGVDGDALVGEVDVVPPQGGDLTPAQPVEHAEQERGIERVRTCEREELSGLLRGPRHSAGAVFRRQGRELGDIADHQLFADRASSAELSTSRIIRSFCTESPVARRALRNLWTVATVSVSIRCPYLIDGDRYAAEWTMSGVHTGDRPGLPATMKPFRISGANVGEVRDGRIARVSVYWNMAEFLVQVGIMPPPGG